MISGFVMIVSSASKFGGSAVLQFIRRRLTRIIPLYWLTTAVYAVKLLLTHDKVSALDLVRSMFFVPYVNAHGEMQPLYGLGWTLNYEIFFYAIFAVGLLWSLRATLALSAIFLGVLVWSGQGVNEPTAASLTSASALFFWSRPIMLFFLVGMVLPIAMRLLDASKALDFRRSAWMSVVVVGVAIGLAANTGASNAVLPWTLALLGGAVVLAAHSHVAADDHGIAPIAIALGDASYSIYLTHSFVLGPLGRLYAKLGWTAPLPFVAVALVLCSAFGWLCHRHVERPLLRWLAPRRRPVPALPVA